MTAARFGAKLADLLHAQQRIAMPLIIAAEPGRYNVLTLDDDGEISADPVLAWLLRESENGSLSRAPFTLAEDYPGPWAIEIGPGGSVDTPEASYHDRATWKQVLIERRIAEQQQHQPQQPQQLNLDLHQEK